MKDLVIAIATVNEVTILVGQDPARLVPIKPICEALGVNLEGQRQRIERDEILNSTACMTHAVGADGKEREMTCLPIKYIFGWLFTIDTSRVNEDARPAVIRYKLECYNALYDYFAGAQTFLKEKQAIIDGMTREYFDSQVNFREAKNTMAEKKKNLQDILAVDYEQWIANSRQLLIPFLASDEEKGV